MPASCVVLCRHWGWLLGAVESLADGDPDDEDEEEENGEDDQLDLHGLKPHLAADLTPLLLEILCLATMISKGCGWPVSNQERAGGLFKLGRTT